MRVLVVEDEPYLAESIAVSLRRNGVAVDVAADGHTALEFLAVHDYDVAVLDRDIPGPSGDDIARHLTATSARTRALMLTASGRIGDKIEGFQAGADDYLTKPFEMRELQARLRALGRRSTLAVPPTLEAAGIRLDPFRREVSRDGRLIALTRKQFAVLEMLLGAAGGVVSAEVLLEGVWDAHADPFTNAVRITISTLRKRLGEPPVIETVSGVGYRIAEPVRSNVEQSE